MAARCSSIDFPEDGGAEVPVNLFFDLDAPRLPFLPRAIVAGRLKGEGGILVW